MKASIVTYRHRKSVDQENSIVIERFENRTQLLKGVQDERFDPT